MRKRKRTVFSVFAFLMAGILLFSGCGNKENSGEQEFLYRKEEMPSEADSEAGAETGKNVEDMDTAMESSTAGAAAGEPAETEAETESARQQELRKTLNIPDTVSESLTGEEGWTCSVNAEVTLGIEEPEIITLGERCWDAAQTMSYAENLFQGEKLYQRNEEDEVKISEYCETIQSLFRALALDDGKTEQEKSVLKQQLENTKKQYDELVKNCGREYDDIDKNRNGYGGYVDWNAGVMEVLVIPDNGQISVEYEELRTDKEMTCNLSGEAARSIADSYLEKMGLSGEMECIGYRKKESPDISSEFYDVRYCAVGTGAEEAFQGAGPVVIMRINDKGLLELRVLGYYTVSDREAAELLDFNEIWENYMEYLPSYSISSVELKTVEITEFRLGYLRPAESNEIIPVWIACGRLREIIPDGKTGGKREYVVEDATVGRINAMTGEVY